MTDAARHTEPDAGRPDAAEPGTAEPDAAEPDAAEPGAKADRFLLQADDQSLVDDLPEPERVMVRFEGEGSGAAGLTWGQVGLWDAMQRQRSWFPIGAVTSLPPATTVADAAAQLRFAMGRYQSLRTRLRFDPDETRQVVSAAGEVPLEVFDAPDGADPARFATRIVRHYSDTDYDYVAEWPIRMAVVRHRGTLRYRVIVVCHLVTDGIGASIMTTELADPDLVAGRVTRPRDTMEPLEQARWQRSPVGQKKNETGLRHCRRILEAVPARRFPEPLDKPQPRYWYASFTSPALHLAVRAVAARTRTDTATVLLAMFAIAHARVTGIRPMMTMLLVSNRYRRGLADTVSPVTQAVPCVIDVAAAAGGGNATVDEVVSHARGRAMAAYKHGYFDPLAFNTLVAEVSRARGEEVDTACYFNDRRVEHRDAPEAAPTAAQVVAALPGTRFAWKLKQDKEAYERFFLHVENVPDTVEISVVMDTHQVSPADAEACLRGMEEVAVAAVTEPERPVPYPR